ncbi:EthD domain-containing protein [Hypoxylon sp. FL1284]|nr:EthD domain-containing protein [Hypoxylon sp. FL1284]
MAANQKLVKICFNVKRKEGLSEEEFHRYWSNDHIKLLRTVEPFKKYIVKYSQFHVDTSMGQGVPKIEGIDGIAQFWVKSVEDLFALVTSEEYLTIVKPDEEKFVKTNEMAGVFGYDEDQWVQP